MKKLILVAMMAAPLLPAKAQLFSQESLGGAAFGGLLGGIIGHNSGRRAAEGAAIGAGAGLFLGALAQNARQDYYYATPGHVAAAPIYSSPTVRPHYALSGAVWGGLAGGIIGHNSGRKTAEGIAIGAGAGLVLGSVAEQEARRRTQYVLASPPAQVAAVPPTIQAATPAPAYTTRLSTPLQASSINSSYASPNLMSGANSLFGR